MAFILLIGAWVGLTSLVASLCFFFLDGIPRGFFILDCLFLGISILLLLRFSKIHEPPQKAGGVLTAAFYALLALNVIAFIFQSMREPHGGWDGWAIWNMHARFLFRGGIHWADFLTPLMDWTNPDYPWLVPATVARFWSYAGRETTLVPALVAFFFTFGTTLLLYCTLKKVQKPPEALMAAIVLLGIPFFLEAGSGQMADVPMSFYILATFVLLLLYDTSGGEKIPLLILAGFCAGLAAWTKNEGLLFIIALVVSRLVVRLWLRERKKGIQEVLFFVIGLIPALAVLGYFKMEWAPPSRIFVDPAAVIFERLSDFSRYVAIAGAFYHQLGERIWNWFPLFLIFYALVTGVKMEKQFKRSSLTFLGTVFFMFVSYSFIYAIAPFDLTFYLQNSLNRLLLQLCPAFLLNYFLLVPVPNHPFLNPQIRSHSR